MGLSSIACATIVWRRSFDPVAVAALRPHRRRIIAATALGVVLLAHIATRQGEGAEKPPGVSATRAAKPSNTNALKQNSLQAQAEAQRQAV